LVYNINISFGIHIHLGFYIGYKSRFWHAI
jgi:hypothetical protein